VTLDPTREQVTLDRINQLEGPNRDYRAVAEVLEAEGWPSPTGEPWTYQAVTSILVMYTGCTASSADPPAVMGYLSQPSGIPSGTGCKPNLEETDVNQIEDAEQHRMLLLKALYKTSDPNRPIQDLNNIFHDFGLDVSDGMAAAQFLVKAGMLRWHSDQQPGAVRLLYPGVVAAEKLLKEEQQAARLAFMRRAYGLVGGSTSDSFKWEAVGKDIGLNDREAALQVVLYLVEKGA
jgi:hypothetical protein